MANQLWTAKAYGPYDQVPQKLENSLVVTSRKFDASATLMASGDVFQIFKVTTNFVVVHFVVTVDTAEGGAATLDIGDGGSTARYETDADLNSAPGVTQSMDAYFRYTADDTIDIIPSAELDTAIFTVTMIGYWAAAVAI